MRLPFDIGGWTFDHRLDLWCVVVAGLVLAWIERGGLRRRMGRERYDAWWFFHLPRSHTRRLGRPSRFKSRT